MPGLSPAFLLDYFVFFYTRHENIESFKHIPLSLLVCNIFVQKHTVSIVAVRG